MFETAVLVETIVKAIIVVAVVAGMAGFATFIERKVLAFMQRRLGPMNVGPYGLLQLAADGIKLFTKEDIVPQNAVKPIFMIAPVIAAVTAFVAMAAVPYFPEFTLFGYVIHPIISDINVALLYVMGVASVGIYGPLLAGMSSSNKWSLLGAARAVVQMLSFEVVSGLSVLAPIMMIGSLSLIDINDYQSGGVTSWLVWKQPLAFILFAMAGFMETNRAPFDTIEFEAEVVAGYATEYSGMRWGLFFIGEYANMITISVLVSIVFMGGYNPVWFIPGSVMMLLKVSFWVFLFLWVRAAWPHIRPDQLMWVCWKVLMPLAVVNILLTGFALI
ncbi:NADH-quinone oxidoreductase subunit NuoH [Sulfurospirillum oryzae]|uniref:NADH-quinone oxidoreductase subunit NuoH n=1 Tax=Sulfurospirillum oryzae TaxID=2976535 RepID=UPI0021E89FC2|nr:NADH-quinone oxidoreductase subunit NuoH [Sulfurospirillum oryzae]